MWSSFPNLWRKGYRGNAIAGGRGVSVKRPILAPHTPKFFGFGASGSSACLDSWRDVLGSIAFSLGLWWLWDREGPF